MPELIGYYEINSQLLHKWHVCTVSDVIKLHWRSLVSKAVWIIAHGCLLLCTCLVTCNMVSEVTEWWMDWNLQRDLSCAMGIYLKTGEDTVAILIYNMTMCSCCSFVFVIIFEPATVEEKVFSFFTEFQMPKT